MLPTENTMYFIFNMYFEYENAFIKDVQTKLMPSLSPKYGERLQLTRPTKH